MSSAVVPDGPGPGLCRLLDGSACWTEGGMAFAFCLPARAPTFDSCCVRSSIVCCSRLTSSARRVLRSLTSLPCCVRSRNINVFRSIESLSCCASLSFAARSFLAFLYWTTRGSTGFSREAPTPLRKLQGSGGGAKFCMPDELISPPSNDRRRFFESGCRASHDLICSLVTKRSESRKRGHQSWVRSSCACSGSSTIRLTR
mmetsp:Transcript_58120/g.159523  ORF Transcript_58120/g.159523 Transcript_58120/m.159523 type:complete len:201 (+) Transcript_58120:454-1056(+)